MRQEITTMNDLALAIRSARKAQGIRQDELAAMIPASHVFIIDVERGKPTAHIGKVLSVLRELGIRVFVDVPESQAKLAKPETVTMKKKSRRNG